MNEEYQLPWGRLTGIRPIKLAHRFLDSGLSPKEAEEAFRERYRTDEVRAGRAVEIAVRQQPMLRRTRENGIELYVGIPFCPSRCVYCSFVSFSVEKSAELMEPYLEALELEIKAAGELVRNLGRQVETVYIGGGTPTTLTAEQSQRLFAALYREFDLSALTEFTVEAGRPDTVTEEKLEVMRQFGVTRISLNPQSMNPEILKRIGRRHTPEQLTEAFFLARRMGFEHINMDVIAGLPDETFPMFCHTLEELFRLDPEGITVHTMSLKRASYLKENPEQFDLTSGKVVGEMISYAWDHLREHGFAPYYLYRQKNILGGYENTGFAKPGKECLYNVFIMEECKSILSVGAGGSTKIVSGDRIKRIFNVKEPTEYVKRIDEMIRRKQQIYELSEGMK